MGGGVIDRSGLPGFKGTSTGTPTVCHRWRGWALFTGSNAWRYSTLLLSMSMSMRWGESNSIRGFKRMARGATMMERLASRRESIGRWLVSEGSMTTVGRSNRRRGLSQSMPRIILTIHISGGLVIPRTLLPGIWITRITRIRPTIMWRRLPGGWLGPMFPGVLARWICRIRRRPLPVHPL